MGTRAAIRFFDSTDAKKPFAAVHVQCDGYPSGLGRSLQAICGPIVNGFGADAAPSASNGMGCLAARIVHKLKTGIGHVYLVAPPGKTDLGGGYTYDLRPDAGTTGAVLCRLWGYDGKTTEYDGPIADARWENDKP